MILHIREIVNQDLDECVRIIREGFLTVANEFGITVENCPSNGAFIKKERLEADKEKGNLMYGLFCDNSLIGFMQLEKADNESYYLEKLTVTPSHRHCGYGKTLLDLARKIVKELGGKWIGIGIVEENIRLKDWYTAYGFRHTGTKKFEHLPFTVGFMELNLE
ncbi:GNAT family N-acetyltransferase [Mobilitalea sibirica]|uniref:GNAT family N-acetyltransferase n=1 Tax=Mobilitalea sibirica TaxID=1462919 RepID=A0A8J7HAN1_9FIRM|nr:GNAT family N-acetyltransferase [Mobilitalea sibirica]MBH1941540.1 GNAT family N-acetyltransferase [Mobilitalea sibirica]